MKTAALLPTPGDPYVLAHWLRNCEAVWRNEVDEVRVLVGGQPNPAIRDFIRERVEAIDGIYTERTTGGLVPHGVALNILITDTDADLVVLLEDDTRIRRPGALREQFDVIRSGRANVCSSPRGSMTSNLQVAAFMRWGYTTCHDLSDGHGMWPAFVFTRREDLLATDRDYGNRSWGPNMLVPGLHYRVPEGGQEVCDTFGGTAFQLRDKLRVRNIPQWHLPWHAPMWRAAGEDMCWFHSGSGSSSGDLCSVDPPLSDGRVMSDPMEQGEWGHRIWWWERAVSKYSHELPELQDLYVYNLQRIKDALQIEESSIRRWDEICEWLISWTE